VLNLAVRRIVYLVFVLVLVSMATSFILELIPGDPALTIIGPEATQEQIDAVHQRLNLDRPFIERYVRWVGNAVQGDLGSSLRTNQPVVEAIKERLPVTFQLAVLAVLVSLLISVPLGIMAAYRQDGVLDKISRMAGSAFLSSPSFLTALILVYLFSVTFQIFPVTGWARLSQGIGDNLRHAFLPVMALALHEVAVLQRLLRSDMITTLQEDYLLAARSKGLPTWHILLRHALRPSSFSLITVAGLTFGRVLGGTVIVETLFVLPGIGRYVIDGIYNKDIIAVQGTVLFIATFYVIINAAIDLAYAWLDPRVRTRNA
jgi:peptide/nickel transport system permease protein